VIVGVVHPGEMGAAVGRQLLVAGHDVVWASDGRSDATRSRAAPFRVVGTLAELAAAAEVVLSICPPHAALDVATDLDGFGGLYVDANAISPLRAREVAAFQPRFVDGGIVGGPPNEPGTTLYLSGPEAPAAAALFEGTLLATRVVGDASAVKMVYAAWTKGTAALLLAIRDVARHYEVEDEWRRAAPELEERLARAERSAATKGWRWTGEMEEIADTFAAAGRPDGFHRAAAEVFAR
jgi:3-hydroxyisobutyrate dehydrogenase-like beta-hydroxyacid dehydrogenase